jgi:hypothetical protein
MMSDGWIKTEDTKPKAGDWVLMYLKDMSGVECYRAGMYAEWNGVGEWLSTANAYKLFFGGGPAALADNDVLYWRPLPAPPSSG